ncbi:TPA: oxidoreductase [bacterium]|nr:oxidoreductase [bacterium]
MKKLRAGVVGVGHMGEFHTKVYTELPQVELVCVVDIIPKRADKVAKQYFTKPYTDYREIYNKVDAVSIAVPTSIHYQVAKDFLERKIPVLLEKPMTSSIEEGEELIYISKKNDVLLQIGHVERFNAAVCELKNIVKDPIFIEAKRLGPKNPRINDCGVVLDLLIHDIDIVLSLVNSPIKRTNLITKRVYSDYEDIANLQIEFENGCFASLTGSRVTEEKIRTLSVTQEDAYIFLDYAEQDLHIHRRASSEYFTSPEILRYKQESFVERIFVHKDNPLKLELSHFVDCIVNGKRPIVQLEDEIRSLKITLEVLKQ